VERALTIWAEGLAILASNGTGVISLHRNRRPSRSRNKVTLEDLP